MIRPIANLRLPIPIRTKLQSLGYEYVEDIERLLLEPDKKSNIERIIQEYNIAEAVEAEKKTLKTITGSSLWHSEMHNPPVAVFHEGLDKLLGGGLPVGRITEICGAPGSGKTQICLQFSVDVQIPHSLGGSESEVLFVTTDFGFRIDRLKQIIQGTIDHFSLKMDTNQLSKLTVEYFLKGVNVIKVSDAKGLYHAIKNLNSILEDNPKVKLVIIDSFSLPLVVEFENLLTRTKIIGEMMNNLLENASKYNLAVVLTNQLTTFILSRKKAVLKPSLGQAYAHRLHVRLLLADGKIYLTKSINQPQLCTNFTISKEGIR